MAPPIKKVDKDLIEKLAAINCSMEEISQMVGVNERTLHRRYAGVIAKGRASGKISLKRKMYEKATSGNTSMMIWLSKNMLGYSDKVEQRTTDDTDPSKKVLTVKTDPAEVKAVLEKIRSEY